MVASAFDTKKKQKEYISNLKAYDGGNTYFDSLKSISVEVDGKMVTDPTGPTEGSGPDEINNDNNTNGASQSVIIIAAAVAGACVLIIGAGAAIHYKRRSQRRRKNEMEEAANKSSTFIAGSSPKDINGEVEVVVDKKFNPHDSSEMETQSEEPTMMLNDMPSSYFGTIESKEGEIDDVSTLGDPYMGDAVNAAMDADNTVGPRYVVPADLLYMIFLFMLVLLDCTSI